MALLTTKMRWYYWGLCSIPKKELARLKSTSRSSAVARAVTDDEEQIENRTAVELKI